MKPRYGVSGMTLLEVLVALALFALAAIVFSAAYVNTLAALRAVAEIEQDAGDWQAVRSILLSEPALGKVEQGGSIRLPRNRQIVWEVKVKPTLVADLFEITLRGRIAESLGAERTHLEVFRVLRPTWSQGTERAKLLERAKMRRAQRGGL